MLTFSVDFSQYRQRVAQTHDHLDKIVRQSVNKAAQEGRNEARRGNWQDKSGQLRRTIQITALSLEGNTYWGEWRTQVPYALFVEEDTRSHMIYQKAGYGASTAGLYAGQTRRGRGKGPHEHIVGRGRALRWVDGSGEHFARSVFHPGTVGFHYMYESGKHARAVLIEELHNGFLTFRTAVWN